MLNPKYQIAYTLLAKLHLATGKPEKGPLRSTFLCRKAVEAASSRYPGPRRQRLEEQLNQNGSALRCYQRALKSGPCHADCFLFLGLSQYNAGQFTANLSL